MRAGARRGGVGAGIHRELPGLGWTVDAQAEQGGWSDIRETCAQQDGAWPASALRSPSSLTAAPDPAAGSTVDPALDKQVSLRRIRIAPRGAASFPHRHPVRERRGHGRGRPPSPAPGAGLSMHRCRRTRMLPPEHPAPPPPCGCPCTDRMHVRRSRCHALQPGRAGAGGRARGWGRGAPGTSRRTALPHPRQQTVDSGEGSSQPGGPGARVGWPRHAVSSLS